MKFIKYLFLILVLFVVAFFITKKILGTKTDIANGITKEKILQIKNGMSIEQVISILGKPYLIDVCHSIHSSDCCRRKNNYNIEINSNTNLRLLIDSIFSDTNYCCEANKRDMENKTANFVYTKPVFFSEYYPMLWIHFDISGESYNDLKVKDVFAKRYDGLMRFGLDDYVIYSTANGIFEKKIFESCFK